MMIKNQEFLSTPSARRATNKTSYKIMFQGISIHALREEGDSKVEDWEKHMIISIHALREEGDGDTYTKRVNPSDFYPRPPRGGRPQSQYCFVPSICKGARISIHALREEGDSLPHRLLSR